MKHAVKKMKSHAQVVVISHFFWREGAKLRRNELLRNACGFFRSLLYQLLQYSQTALYKAMSKYEEMGDNPSWGPQWMRVFLEKEIPQACKTLPIVILVDAIDECSPEEDRTLIMDFLRTLLSKSPERSLRICVSYSPGAVTEEAEIDLALRNYEDIANYVRVKLSALPGTKLSVVSKSRRSIPMEIQEMAQGMFLWAEIACNKAVQMDGHGESAQAILQAIESLPKQLDDMFLELLREMDPKDAEESLKLFSWICFARRPLCLAELQYALIMDPHMKENSIKEVRKNPKFREEQRDIIRACFHLSMGLVKIVDHAISETETWLAEPLFCKHFEKRAEPIQACKGEVRLIHDSVHEFLLSRGFGELKASTEDSCSHYGTEDAISSGHFHLSRSCLRYLSMEELRTWTSEEQKESLLSFPLLVYATTSWLFHTERVERAKKSQDDVLQLLQWPSTDIFNAWLTVEDIFQERYPFTPWRRFHIPISNSRRLTTYPRSKSSLLHVLAMHGLVSLLEYILSSNNIEGNEINVTCQAAGSSSAVGDQHRAVKSSFHVKRINFDEQDDDGRTPLWFAVAGAHIGAVELLLKLNYVNPNTEDFSGLSPLILAASYGSEEMMEAFLKFSGERIQVKVPLLGDVASNPLNWKDVLMFLLNTRLPEVNMTEEWLNAAARYYESRSIITYAGRRDNSSLAPSVSLV